LIVEEAFLNGLIEDERRQELQAQLEADFQNRLTEIHKKGFSERQKFAQLSSVAQSKQVIGEMINLTAGVAKENKKLFEINKAAGIANALINTYQSFTRTLAEYPYPLNIALAGLSLAAGLAQVQAIKSQSFSGGGGAPSGATGGAGATNSETIQPVNLAQQDVSETDQRQQQVQIIVEGNVVADDDFRQTIVQALEVADSNDETRR
jgi:hypothetical protein